MRLLVCEFALANPIAEKVCGDVLLNAELDSIWSQVLRDKSGLFHTPEGETTVLAVKYSRDNHAQNEFPVEFYLLTKAEFETIKATSPEAACHWAEARGDYVREAGNKSWRSLLKDFPIEVNTYGGFGVNYQFFPDLFSNPQFVTCFTCLCPNCRETA